MPDVEMSSMPAGKVAKTWPGWLRPFVAEMLRLRCCPECACELPRELVCPRCNVDHRPSARALHPRCVACDEALVSCGRCGCDWCVGCTPGPVRCPECGRRGS